MKKLSFAVAMIALASTACGSDGDKKDADKDVDAGGGVIIPEDASTGDPGDFPECPRDDIPEYPDFEGTMPPYTETAFTACQTLCGQDQACFTEENCPGWDAFNDCASGSLISCLTVEKGACRSEWEDYNCCADANKCGSDPGTTQEQYDACIDKNCKEFIDDIGTCIQEGPTTIAGMPCRDTALRTCVAPAATPPAMSVQGPSTGAVTSFGERNVRARLQVSTLRAN